MNSATAILNKETLPNFLIIGAFKSGTNSLYHYLEPHPQIFMCPAKEPSFFAFEGQEIMDNVWAKKNIITQFDEYKKLFSGVKDEAAIGEASPFYLVSSQAPERIKHYLPNAKLIAILRNPVDRAYSQWQMEYRQGTEKIDNFAQAVQVKQTGSDGTERQRFVYGGKYFSLLRRFYDLFDRSQISVLLFDNLLKDRIGLLKKIYNFLNVDPTFIAENISVRYNEGGLPRNMVSGFFTQKIYPHLSELKTVLPQGVQERATALSRTLKKKLLVKPPDLSPELRSELSDLFKEDILLLQDLIQEDLSIWL